MKSRAPRTRIYLAPPITAGAARVLDADQVHYLTRVLRLTNGMDFFCFDGTGNLFRATLAQADGRRYVVEVGECMESTPAPHHRLHLVQALLKGSAMDEVIQKATELGATDLWLLAAARSNVDRSADYARRKRTHWLRVIESAAAQCHQLHLPALHGPFDLAACLTALEGTTLILLDPGAPPLPLTPPDGDLAVLIGPEGGWTDAERAELAARGARRHGLGTLVLRAETAPLAILAALRHGSGWA